MKIVIECDETHRYWIGDAGTGNYSLSDAEYADYEEVQARWEAWQDKLAALKPDDYIAPTPPTEEELEFRRFMSSETSILLLQTPDSEAA